MNKIITNESKYGILYMKFLLNIFTALLTSFFATEAIADYPRPWQINFQEPATPLMVKLVEFHHWLLVMCFGISGLVLFLLIYVMIRFSKKNNPIPSTTSHHTLLEIMWTMIPVLILIILAVPSFKILFYADRIDKADMTLKIIAHQWYWQYEYPDHAGIAFDSTMIPDNEIKPGQLRLLEVDNRIILPVNTNVRLLVTSADVIHSWSVPSFGVKTDAVPGRTNESWINILRPGVYYGQCSEICGINHGFMPIAVEAVSKEEFEKWVESKKNKTVNLENTAPIIKTVQ